MATGMEQAPVTEMGQGSEETCAVSPDGAHEFGERDSLCVIGWNRAEGAANAYVHEHGVTTEYECRHCGRRTAVWAAAGGPKL